MKKKKTAVVKAAAQMWSRLVFDFDGRATVKECLREPGVYVLRSHSAISRLVQYLRTLARGKTSLGADVRSAAYTLRADRPEVGVSAPE